MVCTAFGSNSTTSASLPTAIVPFFGNRPNSLAGVVEVSCTKRFSDSLPCITPMSCRLTRRVSMPGAPFGISEKSSLPRIFCNW